ncbi:hypothetical protein CspeluHIS016_0402080 [Cutaneotrichosporon spelunceum]|uniref:SEC7 domain-containing protein n=1 Tax=Cutaneotrichosporon spelunceum TaxID=1672016 RepID=A0AAD3TV01_9TREE|nr:hypothetical protein CspeluHIS016_0402080 [Cutaneotrichosporon spelunceum]
MSADEADKQPVVDQQEHEVIAPPAVVEADADAAHKPTPADEAGAEGHNVAASTDANGSAPPPSSDDKQLPASPVEAEAEDIPPPPPPHHASPPVPLSDDSAAPPSSEVAPAPPPRVEDSVSAPPPSIAVSADTAAPADMDTPPPPPPKALSPEKPSVPLGMSIGSAPVDSSFERVSSRSGAATPLATITEGATTHARSGSVSSAHSRAPSVSTPSRPPSAAPSSGGLGHARRTSTSTSISLAARPGSGPVPQLSTILIMPPLKILVSSKEAKKSPHFLKAAQRALDLCQDGDTAYLHPREIFEPLRLAISNPTHTSVPTLVTSLDLLSKLISHSFFSEPNGPPEGMSPLPDLITHTITLCYSETSPPNVALQVVKALMAIVLSTDPGMLVHQSSLLKAVRTVYNVFVLSNDTNNQVIAQGGLTQMVHHVFSRVARPDDNNRNSMMTVNGLGIPTPTTGGSTPASPRPDSQRLTVESFSAPNPNDSVAAGPAKLANDANISETAQAAAHTPASIHVPNGDALDTPENAHTNGDDADNLDAEGRPIATEELFVKDAFLVFRALCKLSMKALVIDSELDLRSDAMRSKLLSLHLILTILKSHSDLFTNPTITIPSSSTTEHTPFLQATKQYLCQSLSRNAVSPVTHVFELSTEIFWCVLKDMRAPLKKEVEVLLREIFIPILEMRHSTIRQKSLILSVFIRLCNDPQALVEIYLNYDCDRAAPENIYEKLMNTVSKIGQTHFAPPSKEELQGGSSKQASGGHGPAIPPSLSTTALGHEPPQYAGLSPEIKLRRQSLECLVAALKSLATWSSGNPGRADDSTVPRSSEDLDRPRSGGPNELTAPVPTPREVGSPNPELAENDDVSKLENEKQRKNMLMDGVKKFNFKPKRGIEYLIQHGFIRSRQPQDIARFLLTNEHLSKAMIGEYLGEGDDEHVAIMHAFVDMLNFTDMLFTDALRMYLQTFRLPGESQKIDRFMLKFAERYMHQNPDSVFANADAAYILSFSVIMLNTDQHNKNMKQKRMTKPEFVKNNGKINDGGDFPEDFLEKIYDEIQNDEIRMKDEVEAALAGPAGPTLGRDLQREAFLAQSENMASKTEALLKHMARSNRRGARDHYYAASRIEHVRYMFEVAWMPFLAGLSAQLQETDDMDTVELCLDGLRAAIRIVCLFDMELERNAFVTTLAKFTFLNNLAEMKPKNMEAIKTLLDIAVTDGNNLKASWKEVLTCVSQLERMQLISSGMDVPDLNRRASTSSRRSTTSRASGNRRGAAPADELAEESRSSQVTVAADRVFALSKNLSGSAIVDFVKALSEVSWEEIQSTGSSNRPRMFSLQKLVEISYYNMGRIRLEWSNIWLILGEHFNQVCCHNNPNVSFFALDALRQLSMNFLQKEELSHFRFQKDFLRPFEYTIVHNMNSDAREMVLQCLQQMIQARVQNLRSGWHTMFAVFSAASKVLTERVANYAFELVSLVYREHFSLVVRYGAFADLANCLTDFCKVYKFQKISLQAIDMVRGLVPKMLENPECLLPAQVQGEAPAVIAPNDDPMLKYWLPVLNAFFDIIMTGEDLEVRSVALNCLFETLKKHGKDFSVDFWNIVCQQTLFPIFAVLRAKSHVRFKSPEDMSVWLSTTLISALRDLIDLYTFYFDILQRYLDGLLDILVACICQENDTLARIGTSCFQMLLENTVTKLSAENWDIIVTAFVALFRTTTAYHLFDNELHAEVTAPQDYVDEDAPFHKFVAPAPLETVTGTPAPLQDVTYGEQRRIFKTIIVKCVLQLLLIETTHELLQNDDVYNTIPAEHLLRFMGVLDDSWRFARRFNANKDLRMRLWKVGFMKQLPNLLKQESSAAATLINVLLRMYRDPREAHQATRGGVLDRLVPLASEITRDFIAIDADVQSRNVAAWSPVVSDIVRGATDFEDDAFRTHLPTFYPLVADLLLRDSVPEMRLAVRGFFLRAGEVVLNQEP